MRRTGGSEPDPGVCCNLKRKLCLSTMWGERGVGCID